MSSKSHPFQCASFGGCYIKKFKIQICPLKATKMSDKPTRSTRSSLSKLFAKDKKREAQLEELQELLDYGTEAQFMELLVSWGVPREERQRLLNDFREQRAVKRGLRS